MLEQGENEVQGTTMVSRAVREAEAATAEAEMVDAFLEAWDRLFGYNSTILISDSLDIDYAI